jgi:hypothetical protein
MRAVAVFVVQLSMCTAVFAQSWVGENQPLPFLSGGTPVEWAKNATVFYLIFGDYGGRGWPGLRPGRLISSLATIKIDGSTKVL